jgi:hypothetical protein
MSQASHPTLRSLDVVHLRKKAGRLGGIYSLLTFGFHITTRRIFIFLYHTYILSCIIIHTHHLSSGFYHHIILYFVNYTHTPVFVNVNATCGNISVSKYLLVGQGHYRDPNFSTLKILITPPHRPPRSILRAPLCSPPPN